MLNNSIQIVLSDLKFIISKQVIDYVLCFCV